MAIPLRDFKCHRLKYKKGSSIISPVMYLDTETYEEESASGRVQFFRLGWTSLVTYGKYGSIDSQEWKEWYDENELCQYIEKISDSVSKLYIAAHNTFFDLQVISFYKYFAAKKYLLKFYYDKGLTYLLTIRKKKHKIACLSTTNFFECSVKELGKMLNYPKKEVIFGEVDDVELSSYCHRDVEIIIMALEHYFRFLQDNNLGKFSYTKSAQAFNCYCYRFMEAAIYPHHDKEIRLFEREAYAGGRVECFRVGKIQGNNFVTVDVNSMYPYVMKEFAVPTKLINYRENVDLELLKDILKTFCCTAEVEVYTKDPIYSIKLNGKLIFPVGRFKCFLCTEGLKEAMKRGHLLKVSRLIVYRKVSIFSDYVDFFYALKLKYTAENNAIMKHLAKLYLNSLYGKFAQQRPLLKTKIEYDGKDYYRIENYDLVTGERFLEYKMFNTLVTEIGKEDVDSSCVAVAAHITENARLHLWKYMEMIGLNKILYCDTDSIKMKTEYLGLLADYLSDTELGKLKIEGQSKSLEILGLKSYITENKTVIKGIPKRAVKISEGVYQYLSFARQKTLMRVGINEGMVISDVTKKIKSEYDKGTVLSDGQIIPLSLPTLLTLL